MNLEYLESIRRNQELDHAVRGFRRRLYVKNLFPIKPLGPRIPDKIILMLCGLSDDAANILLSTLIFKNTVESWDTTGKDDLSHELRMTSIELRKYGIIMNDLGLIQHYYSGQGKQSSRFKSNPNAFNKLKEMVTSQKRAYLDVPKLYKSNGLTNINGSALKEIESRRINLDNYLTRYLTKGHSNLKYKYGISVVSSNLPIIKRYYGIPEKYLLCKLGFSEMQAEILVLIWSYNSKIRFTRNASEISLEAEIGTSQATLLKEIRYLQKIKLVKIEENKNIKYLIGVKSVDAFFQEISIIFDELIYLIEQLNKEIKNTRINENKIKSIKLPRAVNRKISKKINTEGLVGGFLLGNYDVPRKKILIQKVEFLPIKESKTHHFTYDWQSYYSKLKELKEGNLFIIAEFHTHPDEDECKLHEQDIKKMKMLQRGFWLIFSRQQIKPFWWNNKNNNLEYKDISVS